jgi:hypothetical protein
MGDKFFLKDSANWEDLLYNKTVSRYRLETMSSEDREAWRQVREEPKRDSCGRAILLTTPQSYDSRFAARQAPVGSTSHRITVG